METALTIAGSDSSGGAGIQADLKTFAAHQVHGLCVITAITAQNTRGVVHVAETPKDSVEKQIEAVFDDIQVDSVKIGMVCNKDIIESIVSSLSKYTLPPVILDPVMISTTGRRLLSEDAVVILKDKLIPLCTLITPNIQEAEYLTNSVINCIEDMETACKKLYNLGIKNILIKGGHLEDTACDVFYNGANFTHYNHRRIDNPNTHGTGCTLSSAIAANLSNGYTLNESINRSKSYITNAIRYGFSIGKGAGPTHHFFEYWDQKEKRNDKR